MNAYNYIGKCLATVGLIMVNYGSFAQQSADTLTLRAQALTVDEGLPQGLVLSALQDQSGFMWFGTKDGLARYDGYDLKIYRNDPDDPRTICGNRINLLFEDRKGRIWVSTEYHGTCVYDPERDDFQQVNDLSLAFVKEDDQGRYFMVSDGGEVFFLKDLGSSSLPPIKAFEQFEAWPGTGLYLGLETDPFGGIWLLSNDSVFRMRMEDQNTVQMELRYGLKQPISKSLGNYNEYLFADHGKEQFVLARGDSLLRFPWGDGPIERQRIPGMNVRRADLLDAEGWLWYSTFDLSLARTHLQREVNELMTFEVMAKAPMLNVVGKSPMVEDANGNIWFGSAGYGVFKVSQVVRSIRYLDIMSPFLTHSEGSEQRLERVTLRSLYGDDPVPIAVKRKLNELKEEFAVLALGMVDKEGRYWLVGHGASKVRPFLFVLHPNGEVSHVPLDNRQCIQVFPGPEAGVFVLVSEHGKSKTRTLWELDPNTFEIKKAFQFPRALEDVDYQPISSWQVAPDRTIWMATIDGLFNLDPRDGSWRSYWNIEGDTTSLPGNVLFSVCVDPQVAEKYVWVGTEGNGMARLDLNTGTFKTYTVEDGMSNNVVYGILSDDSCLWLSTNKGVSRFDPRNEQFRHYTDKHGLAGNEFNRYSATKGADGTLFFGGMAGMNYFHPKDLSSVLAPAPTTITGIRLMNRSVDHLSDPERIPGPIPMLGELVLPYNERMITFEYTYLDLSVPEQNQYRYKLEGLNSKWIDAGHEHAATFTNLDPGNYTFRVQGRNSAGVWDEVGASLALVITPPWWGTWWFRSIIVSIIIGLLYVFYRYRLARAMEVVRVRESIARDLHDGIGSTLSSVSLFSTVAQRSVGDRAPEAKAMLGRITESITEVMEAMNDIVWAVDAENDDLEHVVQRMRAYAVRMAESVECELKFSADKGSKDRALSMAQRKNLYLIFKEAVNNAIKYSGSDDLQITIKNNGSHTILRIQDHGCGFDIDAATEEGTLGGNGLRNMQKRTDEFGGELKVNSEIGVGTVVELQFE